MAPSDRITHLFTYITTTLPPHHHYVTAMSLLFSLVNYILPLHFQFYEFFTFFGLEFSVVTTVYIVYKYYWL